MDLGKSAKFIGIVPNCSEIYMNVPIRILMLAYIYKLSKRIL